MVTATQKRSHQVEPESVERLSSRHFDDLNMLNTMQKPRVSIMHQGDIYTERKQEREALCKA